MGMGGRGWGEGWGVGSCGEILEYRKPNQATFDTLTVFMHDIHFAAMQKKNATMRCLQNHIFSKALLLVSR